MIYYLYITCGTNCRNLPVNTIISVIVLYDCEPRFCCVYVGRLAIYCPGSTSGDQRTAGTSRPDTAVDTPRRKLQQPTQLVSVISYIAGIDSSVFITVVAVVYSI